jgi:hypothetical protein
VLASSSYSSETKGKREGICMYGSRGGSGAECWWGWINFAGSLR